MSQVTRIFSTERLVLRPYASSDFDFLFREVLSSEQVMAHYLSGPLKTQAQALKLIASEFVLGRESWGMATLVDAHGECLGFAGLAPCDVYGSGELELGFAFAARAQGQGYATEIGLGLVDYAREVLELPRLLGLAHPENVASLNVLHKLGMLEIARLPESSRGPRVVFERRFP